MDKQDLQQLKYLHKEMELIKKDIRQAEFEIRPKRTTDSVKASSTSFPYTEYTLKISGIDYDDYERRVKRLKNKYERRLSELMEKVEEMNECIESVEDSELRQILALRYINGLTWEEIEGHLNITQRTLHRKHRRWQEESF